MKPYPKYKNSNIDWIGDIPENREVTRLRNVSETVKTGSTPPSEETIYFTPEKYNWFGPGDFNELVLLESKRKISELAIKENKCRLFPANSILLIGIGATVGKVGLVNEPCSSNQQINAIIFLENINAKFYVYYLSKIKDIIVMEASSATLPIFNQTQTKNLVITFPPLQEQTLIANYLDRKTAEIDKLVANKKELIQLLKEERTATINHAVTKGINPNTKLKPSGIEWIGDIPEHWEVKRVDWVSNIVRGNSAFKRDELLDKGEYVALQYGKVYKVDIVDEDYKFFVNSEFYKENQVVSKGDTILISTSETIEDLGHTCYYNTENVGLIGGEQILLKPNREVLNEKYLFYYTHPLGSFLRKYAKGLKVYRFNTNDLKQTFIAFPPIHEQENIAKFIDEKISEIKNLVSKTEKEIELMQEYKTALISEVVTGKVDVREEVYFD
jgi:type I restriction enzyme, S subunit